MAKAVQDKAFRLVDMMIAVVFIRKRLKVLSHVLPQRLLGRRYEEIKKGSQLRAFSY